MNLDGWDESQSALIVARAAERASAPRTPMLRRPVPTPLAVAVLVASLALVGALSGVTL